MRSKPTVSTNLKLALACEGLINLLEARDLTPANKVNKVRQAIGLTKKLIKEVKEEYINYGNGK